MFPLARYGACRSATASTVELTKTISALSGRAAIQRSAVAIVQRLGRRRLSDLVDAVGTRNGLSMMERSLRERGHKVNLVFGVRVIAYGTAELACVDHTCLTNLR